MLEHWESYASMWADPRTSQFIGGRARGRSESWLKFSAATGLWNLLGHGYWAFLDRENSMFVGIGGLSQWERGIAGLEGASETGWAIIPDAWGKGYATEAMQAVLNWADAVSHMPETRCIIDPGNLPSQRVAEKLCYIHLQTTEEALGPTALYTRKAGL
jgi:RimJ/RimL family protein N-acetyltransferase